jgi:hypothetical protein
MNWAKQHGTVGGTLIMDWEQLQGRFDASKAMSQDDQQALSDAYDKPAESVNNA